MIRITALNEEQSSDSCSSEELELVTKEAQEEEAFDLYNKALEQQQKQNFDEAEKIFKELLETELLSAATPTENRDQLVQPSLQLKYSAYKNLAAISLDRDESHAAMEYFLQAVYIDDTDVSLWYKIGIVATKIHNYPLARLGFQQGLECNPNHWLCLDKLISVLYVLNDYALCLHYISKGLRREKSYLKGLVFRDAIYKEHPGLKDDVLDFYPECKFLDVDTEYSQEQGQHFIDEALSMREKRRDLAKPKPRPVLTFQKPLISHTWKNLGERLHELYDYVESSDNLTMGCMLDMSQCLNLSQPAIASSAIADVDQSQSSSLSQTQFSQSLLVVSSPSSVPQHHVAPLSPQQITSTSVISSLVLPELMDLDVDDADLKRAAKRKRQVTDISDFAAKRRSARVRNTNIKKPQQEIINYYDLLLEFLPESLRNPEDDDSSRTPPSIECDNHIINDHRYGHSAGFQVDCSPRSTNYSMLQSTEEVDVKTFIENHGRGCTFLDILYKYVVELSSRAHLLWPPELCAVYIATYFRCRKHFEHPCVLFQEVEDDFIRTEVWMSLVYNELKMDKWQVSKSKAPVSPVISPRSHVSTSLGPDFPGEYFFNDIEFIMQTSVRKDILQDRWYDFVLRALWLQARFHILQGDIEQALLEFDQMIAFMQTTGIFNEVSVINCQVDKIITIDNVRKQIESIRRCQSLEEVQRLYDGGSYEDVVNLLITTFTDKQHLKHKISSDIPERHAQLLLLQDSLEKLDDHKKSMEWGEMMFNEALQQYSLVNSMSSRNDWCNTMTRLLEGLESCMKAESDVVANLSLKNQKRLVRNLIKVITLQMNGPESMSELMINTLLPWILLYRIVGYEESATGRNDRKKHCKNSSTATKDDSDCKQEEPELASSLMLLFTAHEYLGRKSWCCNSDGILLLHTANVLFAELKNHSWTNPHPNRVEIENRLEQCFFCLYGHPNKKTKAKHLQEHGSPQIQLSWERAVQLFEYFKPYEVPEFDSFKTSTISGEVENLLRRIVTLVSSSKDSPNTPDTVTAYIEGSTEQYPVPHVDSRSVYLPVIEELYYLLADYYFKNKEQGKAVKYYILDLCVNPNRLDSWAGMALARSSQIEQKLNSNELKSDGPIYRRATSALRCFKRALEIESTNLALWVEYGSLAYHIQAHASRQLKQKEQFILSPEMVEMLKSKKTEMLETAHKCFVMSSRFEDDNGVEEVWLHHYMLAKIAEKTSVNPQDYLEHYKKAAYHLHEDGARYPKKINYHNPPFLSLESLEVYYRMHASVLKYLQRNDHSKVDYETRQYLSVFLHEVASSPFAKLQEKTNLDRSETNNSDDDDSSASKLQSIRSDYLTDRKQVVMETESVGSCRSGDKEYLLAAIDVLDGIVNKVSLKVSYRHSGFRSIGHNADRSRRDQNFGAGFKEMFPRRDVRVFSRDDMISKCLLAIKQCLVRFPEHYKSLYRLAHYYLHNSTHHRLQWSFDCLVGSGGNQKIMHLPCPALFSDRKNTNFFNGIWRIPVDEIDRPGSFPWHMYRSISFLREILRRMKDTTFLVYLTCQLQRTPDFGKKYLRDVDRIFLAEQVYLECVEILRKQMDDLMQEEPPPSEEKILSCLLDIHKCWQTLQKNVNDPDHINDLLEEAYTMYKLGEVDSSPPVLEQAITFCHTLLQTRAEQARLLQQQKLIMQQQKVIEQTLLSAGIKPCTMLQNDGASGAGTSQTGTSSRT